MVSTSASISLLVAAIVFMAAFMAIAQITQTASFISYRLLAPLLRSTDHRNAYVNAGWGFNLDYHPNLQTLYSWPSMYWFLPNLDFRGVEHGMLDGYHHSLLTSPYDPHLFHKPDSRYFWLGEWFSYPWQHITGVSDRLDIGQTFERVYSNIGSQVRMWRYHWCTSSCGWHVGDCSRDDRLSPLVLGLSKYLVDPNATEWVTRDIWAPILRYNVPGRFHPYGQRLVVMQMPGNKWAQTLDTINPQVV